MIAHDAFTPPDTPSAICHIVGFKNPSVEFVVCIPPGYIDAMGSHCSTAIRASPMTFKHATTTAILALGSRSGWIGFTSDLQLRCTNGYSNSNFRWWQIYILVASDHPDYEKLDRKCSHNWQKSTAPICRRILQQ